MKLQRMIRATLSGMLLMGAMSAFGDTGAAIQAACKVLKAIAKKTPETNIYWKYHKMHLDAFKAVMKKVDSAKKMGTSLEELEKNFNEFYRTSSVLIQASQSLPHDPLKVMGTRTIGTIEDLAYVREYNATGHLLRKSLTEAVKTAKQMSKDFTALEKAIHSRKDFARKFLIEELTLFEIRMSRRYGSNFSSHLRELTGDLESELSDTWEKIEYSADILR